MPRLKKLGLYFHTLRYLRLSQIGWQIKCRLLKTPQPKVHGSTFRTWTTSWFSPTWNPGNWDLENKFTFLSESHEIKDPKDWTSTQTSTLWLYNLHYLDCLNNAAQDAVSNEKVLVEKWIADNQDPSSISWDPYCLSLRLVNLIKWISRNGIYEENYLISIEEQADNLLHKIEFHALANHLFANAKALIFAGAFLQGSFADKCLKKGLKILDREIVEQFGTDGGHYELTPMYHQILMWDVCDLVNLAQCSQLPELASRISQWRTVISRAQAWRLAMLHPNKELAFFNDCALSIAPPNGVMDSYLHQLVISEERQKDNVVVWDLDSSGFYVVKVGKHGKLIFDTGKVGPDYQPGHAHADTLSFELSLFGRRVFVNSGTSMYGESEGRRIQRGTISHNTVSVNNQNSSQVWCGFRVAKRARILKRKQQFNDDNIVLLGEHDGYLRQKISGVHSRSIKIFNTHIDIYDRLSELKGKKAVSRLYLHPDIIVTSSNRDTVELQLEDKFFKVLVEGGELNIQDAYWYPRFGQAIQNKVLEIAMDSGELKTMITWEIDARRLAD